MTSYARLSSLGIEQASLDLRWERDYQEQYEHAQVAKMEQQLRERYHDQNQRLIQKLQKSRCEIEKLREQTWSLNRDKERQQQEIEQLRDVARQHQEAIRAGQESEASLRYAVYMLPRFSGIQGPEYAKCWLESVAKAAEMLAWNDAQVMFAARASLEGRARQWLVSKPDELATWATFSAAFDKRYRHDVPRMVDFILEQIRMEDKDVKRFDRELDAMVKELSVDEAAVIHFVNERLTKEEMSKIEMERKRSVNLYASVETLGEFKELLKVLFKQEVRVDCQLWSLFCSLMAALCASFCYGKMLFEWPRMLECSKKSEAPTAAEVAASSTPNKSSKKRCYNCGEVGHEFSECTEYEKGHLFNVLFTFVVMCIVVYWISSRFA